MISCLQKFCTVKISLETPGYHIIRTDFLCDQISKMVNAFEPTLQRERERERASVRSRENRNAIRVQCPLQQSISSIEELQQALCNPRLIEVPSETRMEEILGSA